MKNEFNKYGRRLTEKEYLNAVASSYPSTVEEIKATSEKERRKKETSLMIDHRLGIDYPQDKRERIHAARERATKKFILSPITAIKSLFVEASMKLGTIKRMPDMDDSDIDRGTKVMAAEFAKEKDIETDDIVQFLGENVRPFLKKLRPDEPKP